MTKLNPQTMKTQYDRQYDTFCRKNHDYGNSFDESLDQFGIIASIVRMSDKMKRLESLTDESKTQQVGSERLLDTLEDLSNYAAMTACWLRGVQSEDGDVETSSQKVSKFIFGEVKPDGIDEYKYLESLTINLKEIVDMLQKVDEFHHKIEEFKMTEEDHKELDAIINRLRTILSDDVIDEELMRKLIDIHVKMNPDVILFQLFNDRANSSERPTDEQEAKRVALFNAEFLNMTKSMLNDLFDNIMVCRDQNIPLAKRLTYTAYRQDKYDKIATLVLAGHIDFGEVSCIVNDYPNLRVAEKNHLLESIVAAAYTISEEPENEKPEFLNKKFHIPDNVLKDLTMPEEEPELKRTVLGMIFPFRL